MVVPVNDLHKKIIEDLEKTGLGSEMRALKIFSALGWRALSGQGYFDIDENKTREIDISAYHPCNIERRSKIIASIFFHISAEVKKSEKPWIVFRRQLGKYEAQGCAWNNVISHLNLPTSPSQLTRTLMSGSLIRKCGWEGTGIHQAFKAPSTPSRWYPAFVSACKACEADFQSNSQFLCAEKRIFLNFHQPLIILDGPLFAADLDGAGTIDVEEIQEVPFRFDFRTAKYNRGHYRVDLVTLHGLEDYLKSVLARQRVLADEISKRDQRKG